MVEKGKGLANAAVFSYDKKIQHSWNLEVNFEVLPLFSYLIGIYVHKAISLSISKRENLSIQ